MMVDSELKDLFFTHHLRKEIEITGYRQGNAPSFNIVNDQILSESMELTESLCSEDELKFGSCESSCFKIKVANVMTPMIQDRYINVKINIQESPDSETYKTLQLGKYKIYSDKPTADRRWRDIVAYDFMHEIINADVLEWYNDYFDTAAAGEVSLRQFRHDFLYKCFSIEKYGPFLPVEEEIDLPLDDISVSKINGLKKLTGKDVLTAIGEINGCFPHINRKGNLTYIFLKQNIQGLYPSNDLYPSNTLFPKKVQTFSLSGSSAKHVYISANYEDFKTVPIGTLIVKNTNESQQVVAEAATGSPSENTYTIENNMFATFPKKLLIMYVAQPLSQVVGKISYRPFEAEVQGNPCFEVGDPIKINTKYQLIESYILTRTLKGIQSLKDSFAAEGKNGNTNIVSSSNLSIETSAEELSKKIDDNSKEISQTKEDVQQTQEAQDALGESVDNLQRSLKWFMQPDDADHIYLGVVFEVDNAIRCRNIRPVGDSMYSCGTANYKWSEIYAEKETISTSDETQKHDINPISEKYEKLFFEIEPLTYVLNKGDRVHIGTTAQRLYKAMKKTGITQKEMAAFCKDKKEKTTKSDSNGREKSQYLYGVRYGEFIMLNTHMLQKLYKRVGEQQEQIDSLKKSVSDLILKLEQGANENGLQ